MNEFPLPIFPEGALSASVITTVWIGVAVVAFFNLRFGWVLSGLVVPGYLVPLLIVKPWAVAVIVLESAVTYFLTWFFSEYLVRFGVWGSLFGRDRFFAIILFSIVVRLLFDGWLLPEVGQWMNRELNLVFDYRNNLHSFGLVIIALMANLYWKTGFLHGMVRLFVTVGITFCIVRFGLMEYTNFTISNLGY
ncbi:MAG: poly-gamma-glutamate biosynthesis protein PgsC/CapC, partial [Sedimenticolaceae bacterium]